MDRRALLASALTAALAAGCGVSTAPTLRERRADIDRLAADATAPVAQVVDGLTTFGAGLAGAIGAPAKNLVFSPASIAFAFGMARAGARGATAEQLDRAFGFPAGGPHTALNAIAQAVVTPGAPRGSTELPVLAIANGLFADVGQQIAAEFLSMLASNYGSGVRQVDFRTPSALEQINTWVREQTAERIDRLFDELDPNTKVVLANAIYLKARWRTPFAQFPTTDEPFTRADLSTLRVPTMHQLGLMGYASGAGWQAVELPYVGDELAMWVLVPVGATPAVDLLAPPTLAAVRTGLTPTVVQLALPRWDFGTGVDLVEAMTKLGVTVPFTAAADFSGMTDNVFIGQAVHRATITVDEWGTEAAAVTGLGFLTSGPSAAGAVVQADHPFAFSIVHKPTGTPLFHGVVADPAVR